MKRSALLILDGEGFRTPGLVQELEAQGWALEWVDASDASVEPAVGALPDLGLFDPAALSRGGLTLLQTLRGRNPRLPLAALGGPGQDPEAFDAAALEPLARLDRDSTPAAWTGILRALLERGALDAPKFTAEDLFGDILSDLENPPPAVAPAPGEGAIPEAGDAGTWPGAPGPAAPEPAAPAVSAPGTSTLSVAEPEDILEQFGNYNLMEKVAVGGMAELFKARQRGLHDFEKTVAIKRILPHLSDNDDFIRMFIDEAKLAAQLSHPNIVQIYDLGKASGFYYIAMEFVDGRDLRGLLRKVREHGLPVPEVLAATVAMKVASALDYAHRKRAIDDKELKLVHRDISPQNILISCEGAVKLVDFGIAKAATKTSQTQAGALKGKLLYMSPEQALGEPLDGRSDIYSLGLVLTELLTGERCFQADSELGVLEKVRLGKVADIRKTNPAVSQEMGAILGRILQKDPDQRYASARLLERDLKTLLARRGAEPTEHDLAEYVNTMLKGTREEVVALVAARFAQAPEVPPVPPAPPAAAARPDRRIWLAAALTLAALLAVWMFRRLLPP